MAGTATPRILLVGAYERDNFGDLLFLLITERYLAEAETVAASVVHADMRSLLGRYIVPYAHALTVERYAAVWVVGGEVGTTSFADALRFSLTPAELAVLEHASMEESDLLHRFLAGAQPEDSAYIPDLNRFAANDGVPLVLNSVGLAGIAQHEGDRREALLASVRRATTVVVRDAVTSDFIGEAGIEHTIAPDLVQTIRNAPGLTDYPATSGHILVQASTRYLGNIGIEPFADSIAEMVAHIGLPITLFAAGTANLHDSYADYEMIRERIAARSPLVDVNILRERDPFLLTSAIRSAALWVGTSLHGRVIASAFDVPRLSFVNQKVSNYASTWDDAMPHGVQLEQLAEAAAGALAAQRDSAAFVGEELARRAHESMTKLVRKYA